MGVGAWRPSLAADGSRQSAHYDGLPVDFIAKILDDLTEEDDWIQLGTLGQNISKLRPAFDPRLYGCRKLSDLIAGQPKRFDLESRGSSATGGKDLPIALLEDVVAVLLGLFVVSSVV